VVHLVPKSNGIGGGSSQDTGNFDPVAFTANDFNGIRERLKRTVSSFLSNKYRQSGPSDFLGRSQQGHGRAQFSIRQLN
jgi:hypothetical protein